MNDSKACSCSSVNATFSFGRLIKVFFKLLFTSCKKYDAVFVGFAPQLIVPFWSFKFKRSELYIDFFISMYDTLCFDRKKFSPDSFAGKRLLNIDKKTLRQAEDVYKRQSVSLDIHRRNFGQKRIGIFLI